MGSCVHGQRIGLEDRVILEVSCDTDAYRMADVVLVSSETVFGLNTFENMLWRQMLAAF